MSIFEREIARYDWGRYATISGDADHVPDVLRAIVAATSPEAAEAAYWGIENDVYVQEDVYSAAEPVASVLLAALLEERPIWVRRTIVEILWFILRGEPVGTSVDLRTRVRERALEGFWLLVREAVDGVGDTAVDVIEMLAEPDRFVTIRSWGESRGGKQ